MGLFGTFAAPILASLPLPAEHREAKARKALAFEFIFPCALCFLFPFFYLRRMNLAAELIHCWLLL
jgi:hypothetical protein